MNTDLTINTDPNIPVLEMHKQVYTFSARQEWGNKQRAGLYAQREAYDYLLALQKENPNKVYKMLAKPSAPAKVVIVEVIYTRVLGRV